MGFYGYSFILIIKHLWVSNFITVIIVYHLILAVNHFDFDFGLETVTVDYDFGLETGSGFDSIISYNPSEFLVNWCQFVLVD